MFDLLFILIFAVVTWCVASEGAGGAGVILITVLLSGLLAMNFFEPLAEMLQRMIAATGFLASIWDVFALVGLFGGFVFLFRTLGEKLAPTEAEMQPMVYEFGRWTCAALTGYVTMAFLAAAIHTAPLPRDFWGYFPPEVGRRTGPVTSFAPDYQWLGFTQYVSEKVFVQGKEGRVFDGPAYHAGEHEGHWPSFPIRYATRRQEIAGGGAGSQPSDPPLQTVPQSSPQGGGGPDF